MEKEMEVRIVKMRKPNSQKPSRDWHTVVLGTTCRALNKSFSSIQSLLLYRIKDIEYLGWFTKAVTSTKKKVIFIFLIAWSHLTSDELTACHRCLADHRPRWRDICWCSYDDRRDLEFIHSQKNTYKGRGQIIKMNFSRICIKQGSYTSLITIFISFKLLIIALIF